MIKTKEATAEVLAVASLKLEGDIVPASWYQHITNKKGKADLPAIIILAHIIYWYRPKQNKDGNANQFARQKKFHADKLQKNYQAFADQFNMSKNQAKQAIKRLINLNLIETELRNITTPGGMALNNVMYVWPIVSEVAKITIPIEEINKNQPGYTEPEPHTPDFSDTPSIQISPEGGQKIDIPPSENLQTNTETTTDTTPYNTTQIATYRSKGDSNENACEWQNKEPTISSEPSDDDLYDPLCASKMRRYGTGK
jgi:hypothetical protein